MRSAILVSSVLGAVLVLAVGLVAFMVVKDSPSGAVKADALTHATPSAKPPKSAQPTKSAQAKKTAKPAKKTVKPTPSAKPTASAPPPPASSAAPSVLTVPAGWKLAFDPSFAGSALSTGTWATCYYWATTDGCNDNPTTEKEWYLPSQDQVSGGDLNLVAQQESTEGVSSSGAAEDYTCRSGMVTSAPSFNFTYGLISITAKIPYNAGLWPALWLAASSHQWPPELDIMEHWYSEPQVKVYDHTVGTKYLGGAVPTPGNMSTGFHTYSLLWSKSRVTWYIDGVQVYTTTSYVPQQSMYFIANVADDSTAAGACSGTMQIQSIKVWQS
jgi:beta-glucanase (GH16 family)